MKREVTLGQALSIAVTIAITIITGWITMNNKVTRLEARQDELEKRYDRIETKIDLIVDKTQNILIELERKQNRP
jgi:uncharacterized protein YoxC